MVCNRLTAGKVFWETWFVRHPPGWDMVCNRLTAGISHRRVTICTPAGGAVVNEFASACRRGWFLGKLGLYGYRRGGIWSAIA